MAKAGSILTGQLQNVASSGDAEAFSLLMATGDGNCFWVNLGGLIDLVDSGGPSDSYSLVIDEGAPGDTWATVFEEAAP